MMIQKKYKISIYIYLILGVSVYTFIYSIQKGMHQTLPEAVNRHVNSIGIAISELKYGSRGYCGYNKVVDVLLNNGMTNDPLIINKYDKTTEEVLKDHNILNNAIQKAINIKDTSSYGRYYLVREDNGLVTYYKLAFRIFGYKIESFFYLYFLLLALSIFIFLITFYRHLDLLNILLLFVCSHFVIVASAHIVGIQLQTVHNARFLTVLAILPAMYLALVILGKHRFTKVLLIWTFIQTALLIFIIHIRSSTVYQIIFLSAVFVLIALWYWVNKPQIGKYVFNKVHFWPLAIVFFLFLILKIHLALSINTNTLSKHVFWHTVYIGLAAHPESKAKYGITFDDPVAVNVVRKHLVQRYGMEVSIAPDLYESILKEEFLKILKADLWFTIKNYLFKPLLFVKNYYSSYFGASQYLFRPILLIIVIAGGLLIGTIFLRTWFSYFILVILGFIFSLLPSILAMPEPYLIAEPALLFTLIIYMIISMTAYFLNKYFFKTMTYLKDKRNLALRFK